MRKMHIDSVPDNAILGKTIYDGNKSILLKEDSEIKPQYKKYLKRKGINSIYIKIPEIGDIEIKEPVSDKVRNESVAAVKNTMNSIKLGKNKGIILSERGKEILNVVDKIIDEILSQKEIVSNVLDLKNDDDYTFQHSVNVSILSAMIGKEFNMSESLLKKMTLGAILHDIGKTKTPKHILNKKGKLTEEEFETVKQHTSEGLKIYQESKIYDQTVGSIIYYHHERCDGSGYPEGITCEELHNHIKIVSVADVYDALVSSRPYRLALPSHEALEHLLSNMNTLYDKEVLNEFIKIVAPYPIGSYVHLNDKRQGYVIKNHHGNSTRPVIRICYEDGSLPFDSLYELDLSSPKNENILIARVEN